MDTDDAIRAWLDAEPKEKWAFSYDYSGHHYGKLTMNLSEVFNNVLKTIRRLLILAIVQIIFLGVIYFFLWTVEKKVEELFSRDVLWPPKVLAEILADTTTSRSHLISPFDLGGGIFQSKIPPIAGGTREVRETINISEATCTYISLLCY